MASDHALGVYSHREDGRMATITTSSIERNGGLESFEEYLDEWAAEVKWFTYCPDCGEKVKN